MRKSEKPSVPNHWRETEGVVFMENSMESDCLCVALSSGVHRKGSDGGPLVGR